MERITNERGVGESMKPEKEVKERIKKLEDVTDEILREFSEAALASDWKKVEAAEKNLLCVGRDLACLRWVMDYYDEEEDYL